MEKIKRTKQKVISIVGTTASGKSSLAIKLAKLINGEIISADSRQVYCGYDIATAKATQEEMNGIKHYLIDVLQPDEDFSAGIFVEMAKKAITEISQKGKIPILVGGTGMYLKMLLDGIDMPKGEPNQELRKELEKIFAEKGQDYLYNMLIQLDSDFAKNIHPNDVYKVMRSIEILKQTNTSMTQSRGKKESDYDVLKIALTASDRQIIYEKINNRVDIMINNGLLEEALKHYKKNPLSKTFNSTIGYQEFVPYFNHEIDLNTVITKIKQNTRRYAKRQLTWFRAQENINWLYIDTLSSKEIEEKALELCEAFI